MVKAIVKSAPDARKAAMKKALAGKQQHGSKTPDPKSPAAKKAASRPVARQVPNSKSRAATVAKPAPRAGSLRKAPKAAKAPPSKPPAEAAIATHDYSVGTKVNHPLFGTGTVREVKGEILAIEFKKGEVRFVREDFVSRA